jgi:hypothetical protein
MTDAYRAIQQRFMEGLAALEVKLAAEEDADEVTKTDLTSQVYADTFGEVVKQMTKMQLPAFCKQLGLCLDREVLKFSGVKILYSTLRSEVQDTVQKYGAATRVASTADVAIVGPLIGRLEAHETSLGHACASLGARRQMRHYGECLRLLKWMEHMHLDASSPSMKVRIRQWRSTLDSLSADVLVKYNPTTGLPLKFSANALGLLLDLVVDRLRGTSDDDDAGAARMKRLQQAHAPFTGEAASAARLYAGCISRVHAETFAQLIPLPRDAEERSSAPLLPQATQPAPLPRVPSSLGSDFGQQSWGDISVARGMHKVVPTTPANPPLPPGPPPPLSAQQSPAVSFSPPHGGQEDSEEED